MKIKYFLTFVVTITLCCLETFALYDACPPAETAILMLPDNIQQDWKCIMHVVDEKEGIVEYIPSEQNVSNITDLITIVLHDISSWKKTTTIDALIERIKRTQLKSNPNNRVQWKILEKNENDFIYEAIRLENKNLPFEHELVRIFLKDKAFYRVSYVHKQELICLSEKEKWLNTLKQNCSVVPIKEASMHSQAFSLLSRAFTSVDLDPLNEEWKLCQNFAFENGFSLLAFVPSSYKDGSYVDECIELVTMPCVNENKTINQIFATDRKIIQEETNERVMFDILKETSTEVIYCYSYPKDHLRLNAIVRTSVDNKGYRSLSYKRGIIGKMKQEDVLFWQNKLEAIDINSRK